MIGRPATGFLPGNGFYRSRDPRERRVEVGNIDERKQQGGEPEGMLVREEGKQTEHSYDIELNLL